MPHFSPFLNESETFLLLSFLCNFIQLLFQQVLSFSWLFHYLFSEAHLFHFLVYIYSIFLFPYVRISKISFPFVCLPVAFYRYVIVDDYLKPAAERGVKWYDVVVTLFIKLDEMKLEWVLQGRAI